MPNNIYFKDNNLYKDGVLFEELITGVFDLVKLTGYKENHNSITGYGSTIVESSLVPCWDNSNICTLKLYAGANEKVWEASSVLGIADYSGVQDQSVSALEAVYFEPVNGSWVQDNFANEESGFYWMCLPGSTGESFRFWYDKDQWNDRFGGTSKKIYIDEAGLVWDGSPNSGYVAAYPSKEKLFGDNLKHIYVDTTQDVSNSFCPCTASGVTSVGAKIYINNSESFSAISVGETITWGGLNNGQAINASKFRIDPLDGVWKTFSGSNNGLYSIQLPNKDNNGTNNQGTKVYIYYSQEKYTQNFLGSDKSIYVDGLGNVFDGDPDLSTSRWIAGPYAAMRIDDSDRQNQLREYDLNYTAPNPLRVYHSIGTPDYYVFVRDTNNDTLIRPDVTNINSVSCDVAYSSNITGKLYVLGENYYDVNRYGINVFPIDYQTAGTAVTLTHNLNNPNYFVVARDSVNMSLAIPDVDNHDVNSFDYTFPTTFQGSLFVIGGNAMSAGTFTQLGDTPVGYQGAANHYAQVKPTEDGIRFVPAEGTLGETTFSSYNNGTTVTINSPNRAAVTDFAVSVESQNGVPSTQTASISIGSDAPDFSNIFAPADLKLDGDSQIYQPNREAGIGVIHRSAIKANITSSALGGTSQNLKLTLFGYEL